jgi:isopentenyl diphosphate isomerase/L-lactate dehydrogenase-like FMN-dependent dehydrogenase
MLAGTSEPTSLWIRVSRTASHTTTVIEILGEYTVLQHTTAVQQQHSQQQQKLQAHTLAQLPPVPRTHPGSTTFLSSRCTDVSAADWTVDIPYAYHAIGSSGSSSSGSSSRSFTVAALSQLTSQTTSDSTNLSSCSWKWVVAHRHADAVSTDSSSSSDSINRCSVAVQDILSVHNHSDVDMYVALQSADVSRYVLQLKSSCHECSCIASLQLMLNKV